MIRWLFRALGALVLLTALAAFGNELANAVSGPSYRIIPLGELWASLHANSLIGLQTVIEAASPWLWRAIVLPILLGPAWAVPLGIGIVLRLIGGRAPRTRPAYRREIVRLFRTLGPKPKPRAADAVKAAPAASAPEAPSAPPDTATPDPSITATPHPMPSHRREPTIVRRRP